MVFRTETHEPGKGVQKVSHGLEFTQEDLLRFLLHGSAAPLPVKDIFDTEIGNSLVCTRALFPFIHSAHPW